MSSGGSGDTPIRWGGGGAAEDDCGLSFRTDLLNPDPDAVGNLRPGDKGLVDLNEERMSVLLVRDGKRIGSIGENVPALIRCIRNGNHYSGTVLNIDGGKVTVNIARE